MERHEPAALTSKMQITAFSEALDRWWSSFKWAAARSAGEAFPGLAAASLQIDAEGLVAQSAIPRLFSRNLREISPSLNEDLLDLFERSDQRLANHFTFLNRSRRFEAEIDWESDESLSWRVELQALDAALDLALTYRISLEERYAHHLRYLIAHWIAENPSCLGTGWTLRPLAQRVRNSILAADLARADWERDPEFLEVVRQSLAIQSTCLLRQAGSVRLPTEAVECARALLLAGKFFRGGRGTAFRAKGLEVLSQALDLGVNRRDREQPMWPDDLLRMAAAVSEWLVFEEEGEEADFLRAQLREILSMLEGVLLPDGTLPRFGPTAGASKDEFADVAALAAVLLGDPTWKSLAGKFGILPYMLWGEDGKARFEAIPQKPWIPENRLLPQAGFYRLVGAEGSALVINGQDSSSPEDHADQSSFELSIQGQRVLVDAGAFSPGEEPESAYFRSALAHNVLLVDGAGPRATAEKIARRFPKDWERGPGFTALSLSRTGFDPLGFSHQRAWFSLEGGAWVVLDRLEGEGARSTVSLLHFFPTLEIECRGDRAIARSRALTVTVIALGQPQAQMTVSRGDEGQYPGWYSPEYGIKYPASVLALEWPRGPLPWMAGYLIISGAEAMFRAGSTDPHTGEISFELSGIDYRLAVCPRREHARGESDGA